MSFTITEHTDNDELAKMLGSKVCEQLGTALNNNQPASLVLSGGSTPKPLFEFLRTQEIAWQHVTITLADERCVSEKDDANNGKMIQDVLLRDHARHAKFISLYDEVIDNKSAINRAEDKLKEIPLPYDVVILGMGPDGHTASIFPSGTNLDAALDMHTKADCLLVDPITVRPLRITQTRKRLINAKFLALHFTGQVKRDLFNSIIKTGQQNELPVSAFIYQDQTPLHIFCSPIRN